METTITEKHMETNMDNDTETELMQGVVGVLIFATISIGFTTGPLEVDIGVPLVVYSSPKYSPNRTAGNPCP